MIIKKTNITITGTSKPKSQELIKKLTTNPENLILQKSPSMYHKNCFKLLTKESELIGYVKNTHADFLENEFETIEILKEDIKIYGGPTNQNPTKFYGISVQIETELNFKELIHQKQAGEYNMLFGKYKGMLLLELINTHPNYCILLSSKPDFKENNKFLTNIFRAYDVLG